MISPDYCVIQARLARWRNRQLVTALSELDAVTRRKALQAGPGSVMVLCARMLAQDRFWLTRLDGGERPRLDDGYDDDHIEDWGGWRRDRQDLDARLHAWATRLTQPDLEGELFWFSPLDQRAVSRPSWLCVTHLFTAQAELRGRIFTHLALQGAAVPSGDLIGLPHDLDWM